MYNQITSNKRKTFLLILIFIGIIIGLGYILGQISGYGQRGVLLAMGISLLMTLISYYSGDKLALAVSGAKQIQKSENPYLWRIVENLSITAGLPMPKLHLINDQAINAFATGRDPEHSSVAVTTGAILKLENEELEGVLAHELSHVKNYDIRVMTIVIVLVGAIALISDWMFRAHFLSGRGDRDRSVHPIFLIIGLLLAILTPIFAQLIQLAVSRKREYLADASGALLTRFPEGLARALEKISLSKAPMARANSATAHMFISNPFGASRLRTLFSTHPPIEERIKILRSIGN